MPTPLRERRPDTPGNEAVRRARRPARRRLAVRLAAAGIGLVLLVPLADRAFDLLPGWENPFREEIVDRSTPPLLLALEDLSEYHAATGTFQVVVDHERDVRYVPSVISGERAQFLATGTVDAYVDFGNLDADRVQISADRQAVTIELPAPRLDEARVDPQNSRVLDRDRGLLDRLGGVFSDNPSAEGELYALAEDKLARAAADSDLLDRAEENTRAMLTTLVRSLGYERVTVTFDRRA